MGFCYLCGKDNGGGLGACSKCKEAEQESPSESWNSRPTDVTSDEGRIRIQTKNPILIIAFAALGILLFVSSKLYWYPVDHKDWRTALNRCKRRVQNKPLRSMRSSQSDSLTEWIVKGIVKEVYSETSEYACKRIETACQSNSDSTECKNAVRGAVFIR